MEFWGVFGVFGFVYDFFFVVSFFPSSAISAYDSFREFFKQCKIVQNTQKSSPRTMFSF